MRYITSKILKPIALIFASILSTTQAAAQLSIESVYPTQGKLGEDLQVVISGTGFNGDTRVSIDLDFGSSRLIKGRFETGGRAWETVIDGDLAYVATGSGSAGLQIINISQPSNPALISKLDINGAPYGVAISKDLAYLAGADRGLHIVDVSNPLKPVFVGSVDTPGFARKVTVVGSLAYVADSTSGLHVINVTKPSSPSILASLDVQGDVYDVEVKGHYAFLAARDIGLKIVDVSNPNSLRVVSSVASLASATGITIADNTAYVVEERGLNIVDITDPMNPKIIKTIETFKTGSSLWDVDIVGNRAYAAGSNGLLTFDIENPANASLIGTVVTSDRAQSVSVVGNTAYVSVFTSGLEIVDITTPVLPVTRQLIGTSAAFGVFVDDSIAYVATGGLQVIDISTPSSPTTIASIETNGSIRDVVVDAGIAYLANEASGLQIINISTPSRPITVGGIATPGSATGVDKVGNRAYIADGNLQIIDISDPARPKIIATVETPGVARGVKVVGNIAYVADNYEGGLQIIDISNPGQPKIIGNVASGGIRFNGVDVEGNRAYVAGSSVGLYSIDISDPTKPKILAIVDKSTYYWGVSAAGDTLYGAGYSGAFIVPLPRVPEKINVISSTRISLALPSPTVAGHYTLRVSNTNTLIDIVGNRYQEFSELYGAVSFARDTPIFSEPASEGRPSVNANSVSKAVIVAGGGPYPGNNLWSATVKSANFAYRALLYQGYRRENILYLSPDRNIDVDGDGLLNDIDGAATGENLEDAILRWTNDPKAPAHELLLYIVDHGGDSQFRLNQTELLPAQQLDGWLDELQQKLPGKILVVYDACQSGTFIPKLRPPAGKDRIVMTSAANENAYFINQGGLSFSYQFWSSIFSGASLYDSFVFGKRMMLEFQAAQLDSNGNGVPNEKADQELANKLVIGRGFVPASDKPFISVVSAPQVLRDTTKATISASGIIDATGISRVWGVISHPAFTSESKDVPVLEAPKIELTDPDGDNTWVGSYEDFKFEGVYTISIYAENNNGFYSIIDEINPSVTTVQKLTINKDSDNDGVIDALDAFPYDKYEFLDADDDGVGDNADIDDDNDSILDGKDASPLVNSFTGDVTRMTKSAFTTATDKLVIPLVKVVTQVSGGSSISWYGPVTLLHSHTCSGRAFTVIDAKKADELLLANDKVTQSTFTRANGELLIPRLDVMSVDIFGKGNISSYADIIMGLATECAGISFRVEAFTPL